MFVCGWNFVCRTISYLRRQTFRPYGTVADVVRFSTNIPSLRDGPPMLNGFSTNIPSLRDGSPGSTMVPQTCRPSGTVSCSMIVLHNWSRWDRLVRRTAYCLILKFGGHP